MLPTVKNFIFIFLDQNIFFCLALYDNDQQNDK